MSNTNPFLNRQAFNPGIATRLERAYVRNVEVGRVPGVALASELGAKSLASEIMANAADAKNRGGVGLAGFDQLLNDDTKRDFEESFAATELLFEPLGLVVPTSEQCVDAGIDLAALGAAYERMQDEGLEPAIVLSPVLGISSWRQLYQNLAKEQVGTDSLKDDGLQVDETVAACWDKLARQPVDDIKASISPDGTLDWSLRLIPATRRPTDVMVDHNHNHAKHPTVCEYLSLQAVRIQALEQPIDGIYSTWLNGTVNDNGTAPLAPFVYWDSIGGCINIFATVPDFKAAEQGTRMPVWE